MIWFFFFFLFLNELGFIAYQTYLYNLMCMDLFYESDLMEYSVLPFYIDYGIVCLENAWSHQDFFYSENVKESVYELEIHESKDSVYHLNFTSQWYPHNDEILFQVMQRHIYTAPGDLTLIFFHMENLGIDSHSGVTVYTISPFYLSYYVQKIQCFCFEELQLQGKQLLELPVIFYIDPLMENSNGYSLTVEYTFLFV